MYRVPEKNPVYLLFWQSVCHYVKLFCHLTHAVELQKSLTIKPLISSKLLQKSLTISSAKKLILRMASKLSNFFVTGVLQKYTLKLQYVQK